MFHCAAPMAAILPMNDESANREIVGAIGAQTQIGPQHT